MLEVMWKKPTGLILKRTVLKKQYSFMMSTLIGIAEIAGLRCHIKIVRDDYGLIWALGF